MINDVSSGMPIGELADLIRRAAQAAVGGDVPSVEVSPPASAEHGDVATPIAMVLARSARRAPRDIAADVREALLAQPEAIDVIFAVDVAGPGFLNIRLTPRWFARVIDTARTAGGRFGARGDGERVLLEFVSANPTGPLHVGHARNAAYGDSLARILSFAGRAVTREFYANDHGRQMTLFGASLAARDAESRGAPTEIPDGGYHGDYIRELAAAVRGVVHGDDAESLDSGGDGAVDVFAARGAELMLARIMDDLAAFRVHFDRVFSEATLHREGRVADAVAALARSGDTYVRDGAHWFRTSAYGDEKDRVLVRADGTPTYLASDVAYHLDKAARAGDRLIDILGADHHGYVARLRAILAAGGCDPDMLLVPIMQLVSLSEGGEAKRMSKRAGTLVTLSDLVSDIGVDAARFFLVQRSHETAFELDLDLAREQSQENPVFYVQYAHARACSIIAQATRGAPPIAAVPPELVDADRAVVLALAGWPEVVAEAADRLSPHRIVAYLIDLARDFHHFYHRCRVYGEPADVEGFRLALCDATRRVIATGLDLIGVSAPERM